MVSEIENQPPAGGEAELRFSENLCLEVHGRQISFSGPLSLKSGELALLTGPTGGGKTSFLTILAGLTDYRLMAGQLDFEPGPKPVGVVTQNPDLQTLGATVWEDVLSGALNYGVAPDLARQRAQFWLDRLGLSGKETKAPEQLSAGQRQRVALASALTIEPGFLLLDEPLSQLDQVGRDELLRLLGELKQDGLAVLLIEHRAINSPGLVDHRLALKPAPDLGSPPHLAEGEAATKPAPETSGPIAIGCQLTLTWPATPENHLEVDDFVIAPGQTIGVTGPNGSGKSTLFAALANLGPAITGQLSWFGQASPPIQNLVGRVGFLAQNPERQFFNETVGQEIAFVLKRQNLPPDEVVTRTEKWQTRLGLTTAANKRPGDLSFGQKHLLGLAMTLAPEPDLIILDEPFTGLDGAWTRYLKKALNHGWGDYRPALMLLCHDEPEGLELDQVWHFEGHRLITGQDQLPHPDQGKAKLTGKKNRRWRRFGYLGQYQPGQSWLHRLSPAWKFGLMTVLATGAILSRSPWLTLAFGSLTTLMALSAGLGRAMLRDLRTFMYPLPFMVLLYCLRFGFNLSAVQEALAVSARLITAGLPFLLLQRSTDPEALQKKLGSFLSTRNAFLLSAGLKIAPLLFREAPALLGLQRLRGARLYVKGFFKKEIMTDWLLAFFLPLTMRIMELAGEMAIIARLRGLEGNPARPIHLNEPEARASTPEITPNQ